MKINASVCPAVTVAQMDVMFMFLYYVVECLHHDVGINLLIKLTVALTPDFGY